MSMRKFSALVLGLLAAAVLAGTADATVVKTITKGSRSWRAATTGGYTDAATFSLASAAALTVCDDDTSQTFSVADISWFDNPTAETTSTRAWLVVTSETALDSLGIGWQVSMDGRTWAVGAAVANATVKSTVSYNGGGWAARALDTDINAAGTAANPTMFPYIRVIAFGDANTAYTGCRYHIVYTADK